MKEIKNDLLRKAKGIKVDFRNYSTIISKEKKRIANRSYYIKNREKRLIEYKNYYEQNKEMILQKRKESYSKRKKIKERNNRIEKKTENQTNKEIEFFRSEGGQFISESDGMTNKPKTSELVRSTENSNFKIDIHLDGEPKLGRKEDQDSLRPRNVNEERVIKNSKIEIGDVFSYPNKKRHFKEFAKKWGLVLLKRKTKYNKNKKYENSLVKGKKGKKPPREGPLLENARVFGFQRNKKSLEEIYARFINPKIPKWMEDIDDTNDFSEEKKSVYNLEPSTDDLDNKTNNPSTDGFEWKTNKLDYKNKTKMKNKKTIPSETNKKDKDKKSKLLRNFEESAFLYNLALQTKKLEMNRYNLNIPNFSLLLNTSGVMAVGTNKLDYKTLSINQMYSNLFLFNCSTVGRNCGKTIENDMCLRNKTAFGPNSLESSVNVVRKNLFSFKSSQTSLQLNHPYIFIPKRFMETQKEINNKQMTLPKNRIHEIQTKIRGRKPKTKKIEPDWTNPRYFHVKGICFGKDRKQIIKGYSKEYARTCEEIYIPKFYDKKN